MNRLCRLREKWNGLIPNYVLEDALEQLEEMYDHDTAILEIEIARLKEELNNSQHKESG